MSLWAMILSVINPKLRKPAKPINLRIVGN